LMLWPLQVLVSLGRSGAHALFANSLSCITCGCEGETAQGLVNSVH
jgi:hypothetical protein